MKDDIWTVCGYIIGVGLFIALFVGLYACNEAYEDDCRSRGGQVVKRLGKIQSACVESPARGRNDP